MRIILIFLLLTLSSQAPTQASSQLSSFVSVRENTFVRYGERYNFMGANFWYAMNLAATSAGRQRLKRELDHFHDLGIRNLRILGASEGPDSEPWRVTPSLQPTPGRYNQNVLRGLDFVLKEMKKRDLTAVIILNNFWEWSGGMAQYRRWAGAEPIPYPPAPGFIEYTSKFYGDVKAMRYFDNFLKMIIPRYANDPTVMAWELANEPRGGTHLISFNRWIRVTAKYIKNLDPNHLVTTGVEGDFHDSSSGLDLLQNHHSPFIDYATLHVWAQNAGVYDPLKPATYSPTLTWAGELIQHHGTLARKLGKPLVLEEFGLARDQNAFTPDDPVTYRDDYYSHIFDLVYQMAAQSGMYAGINFLGLGAEKHRLPDHWGLGGNPAIPS